MSNKYIFFTRYCLTAEKENKEKYFTEDIKKKFNVNEKTKIDFYDSFEDVLTDSEKSTTFKPFFGDSTMIFLSPGTYNIPEGTLPGKLVLIGLDDNVHIKLNKKFILTGNLFSAHNIHFDLVLDVDYNMKDNFCTSGIIIPNGSETHVKFRNCIFDNEGHIPADSIYFGSQSTNVSIIKCRFKNTKIKFSGYPANLRNCSVKNNIFESSIIDFHTYDGHIFNNNFIGNSKITMFRSNVNINMNIFKNVNLKMIHIDYSSRVCFSNNFVITNPSNISDQGSIFSSDRSSKCLINNNTFITKKNQAFLYCQWDSHYTLCGNVFNNPDIVVYYDSIKMKSGKNFYPKNNEYEDHENSIEQIAVPNRINIMFSKFDLPKPKNDSEETLNSYTVDIDQCTFKDYELIPLNIISKPISVGENGEKVEHTIVITQ